MAGKKQLEPLPQLPAGTVLVDTHCHLEMEHYNRDRPQVVARALEAGVGRLITIGIDPESSGQAVALAEAYPEVYATVGVHPHHVEQVTAADYERLAELAAHPRVIGYGEIGLDLVKNYAPFEVQREHFRHQVQLAKDLGLPLIIHDREAHDEVLAILNAAGPFPAGGIMHCFSGDAALARRVLDLGFLISIPGVVTFNKAEAMQQVAREVPLSKLLVETDGPFLAPVPWRGKRNEPAFALYTAQKIAELRSISLAEVARRTTENVQQLFGITI